MNDLTSALHAAADRATAERVPLPAAPVLGRIRRRRTARTVAQGAVGVAAAGAVAVGGTSLAGRIPRVPATSPAASRPAHQTEVACGTALDAFAQPEGAPEVTLGLDPYDDSRDAPADAQLALALSAQAAPDAVPQTGTTVTFALIQDRKVVALPEAGWSDHSTGTGFEGQGDQAWLTRYAEVRFSACRPDGTLAGTPAPGTYGVVAFLVPDGSKDWPIPFRSNGFVVHLDEAQGTAGRPDLDELVISDRGLGPVRLGEAAPTEDPAPTVTWRDSSCVQVRDDGTRLDSGHVATTYLPRLGPDGTFTEPFSVFLEDGLVTRVEVLTAGPATTGGIQVGDDLDRLLVAHPDATHVGSVPARPDGTERDVWALRAADGSRTLTFEVAPGDADRAEPGVLPGTILAIVANLGPTAAQHSAAMGDSCDWG